MVKKCSRLILISIMISGSLAAQKNEMSLAERQEKINLALAESLLAEGEYNRALSIYLDFIDLYPDSTFTVRALESLAGLYEKIQRYDDALEIYETLYQRTGTSSSKGLFYYYNQARILNLMGDVDRSEKIFAEIMRVSPDSPYAKKSRINNRLNTLFPDKEESTAQSE